MKISEIKNSLSSLSGIGQTTQNHFAQLNIFTVGDLLNFFPRTYEDRTKKVLLENALENPKVHTIAKVLRHEWFGYGRMRTLKIVITDGSGTGNLIAFNRGFLEKTLPVDSIISVSGKFELKYNSLQSTSFEAQKIASDGNIEDYKNMEVPGSKIYPVYHLTEGLSQKTVFKAVNQALNQFALGIEDEIPSYLIEKYKLLHKKDAIFLIHEPKTFEDYNNARRTLVYEEFFNFQKSIAIQSLKHRGKLPSADTNSLEEKAKNFSEEEFIKSLSPRQQKYLQKIPFELTDDQKKAVFLINSEIDKSYKSSVSQNSSYALRSLLQGDVGSGKTLVSFFAALRVIDWGSQACLMAPTEILARQHAQSAAKELESLDVKVAFLTGNLKSKGRLILLKALQEGNIDFVIGTHALFSKNVIYKDLALSIIDEQHRFGVMQRSAIIAKGRSSVQPKLLEQNLLMMSATPIPQTLALTAFGDLDIITIKSLPNGRKTVQTFLSKEGNENKVYEAVRSQLKLGHQAYFVYPAIQSQISKENDFSLQEKKSLKAAEDSFELLQNHIYSEYKCALIHGKISDEEQSKILTDFKDGKIQVLVATTVVEVGVDVPNATCIVIEMADHFGLAALHQLRGRVGRSNLQSYCYLIYSKNITENGIERMKAIRLTNDGFKIAEQDLKLRGPGEISGTLQSGELSFALGDLFKDARIMDCARTDAFFEAEKSWQK